MRWLILAMVALAAGSCSPPQAQDSVLQEARAKFTYAGRPIHPKLVQQFMGWLSDSGQPVVVTVDVTAAAVAKNAYDADAVRTEKDEVAYEYQTEDTGPGNHASFGYERLGALRDGTQALETSYWGGGSGVFQDIVLVRFSMQSSHLYMTIVARRAVGDRSDAKVRVLDDRAVVGIGQLHGTEYVPGFEVRVGDFDPVEP